MTCGNCGHQSRASHKVCQVCGAKQKSNSNIHVWLIPIITALFVCLSAISYAYFEEEIALTRVQQLIEEGEEYVRIGELMLAKAMFEQAKVYRPNNKTIILNLKLVNEALFIEKDITFLKNEISSDGKENTNLLVKNIEADIAALQSNQLQTYLSEKLSPIKMKITLKKLEAKLEKANSLTEFAIVYTNLSNFGQDDVKELLSKTNIRFTEFIIEKAKKEIEIRNYKKANELIEFALLYDYENKILSDFQENSIQPYLSTKR
jgi:hypothetical protein